MSKFSELRFASKVVIISIISIITYIISDIVILLASGVEPSITPYVFGFFGGELTLLAAKRIFVKEDSQTTPSVKTKSTKANITDRNIALYNAIYSLAKENSKG